MLKVLDKGFDCAAGIKSSFHLKVPELTLICITAKSHLLH